MHEYAVVKVETVVELVEHVNDYINSGFTPIGGIIKFQPMDGASMYLLQAMYK